MSNDSQSAATLDFLVDGMMCAACVTSVQKAVAEVPGVERVEINFATEKATVTLATSAKAAELVPRILVGIQSAGYEARSLLEQGSVDDPANDPRARRQRDAAAWKARTLTAAAMGAPVAVLEMGSHIVGVPRFFPGQEWVCLIISLMILIFPGRPFFVHAAKSLRRGVMGMETLVALGSGTAWLHSAGVVLFTMGKHDAHHVSGVYFESAAVILALVSFGKWMESAGRLRAGNAMGALLDLSTRQARLLRDGGEVEIPTGAIMPDDLLLIKPGERFPVDGVVTEGTSSVDQSMLTGESMPVFKEVGAPIFGGTINGNGLLKIRATHRGADSALARMIRVVEKAQSSKAAVQYLADKVSAVFVPVILVISVVTLLLWGLLAGAWSDGLLAAVSVLVIACPCALGLATPLAIMVGTSMAARSGMLVRDVTVLETAQNIDTMLFDKTGTLTMGRPVVTDVLLEGNFSRSDLLTLAGAVESGSDHPLAKSILTAAGEEGIKLPVVTEVQVIPGSGIRGSVATAGIAALEATPPAILVASPRYLMGQGLLRQDAPILAKVEALESLGKTVVGVIEEGKKQLVGFIAVADPIKPEAKELIALLSSKERVESWMVTGDNRRVAEAVAAQIGIPPERVFAEVLPEEKSRCVDDLRQKGKRVAFVGDGINDAPALALADLGIALSTGTDIAMETASITLLGKNLNAIPGMLALGRETLRVIRQNLFLAFAYNVLLVPIAALGLLNPMLASAAMGLSSISVVGNSLLLAGRLKGKAKAES